MRKFRSLCTRAKVLVLQTEIQRENKVIAMSAHAQVHIFMHTCMHRLSLEGGRFYASGRSLSINIWSNKKKLSKTTNNKRVRWNERVQKCLWKLPENTCRSERVSFIAVQMRKHENYARDTIDGLNLAQQSLLSKCTHTHTHWRRIKNKVQRHHHNNINDGDDDDEAVTGWAEHAPLLSVIFEAHLCAAVNFHGNQTDLGNYNFMQISLVLVSPFAPSTHFLRHNFGWKPSNYYILDDKNERSTSYRLEIFGIAFCMQYYYHYYQKNLSQTNTILYWESAALPYRI